MAGALAGGDSGGCEIEENTRHTAWGGTIIK